MIFIFSESENAIAMIVQLVYYINYSDMIGHTSVCVDDCDIFYMFLFMSSRYFDLLFIFRIYYLMKHILT